MRKGRLLSRLSVFALLAGGTMGAHAVTAGAAVLIRADFSGVTETSLLGPDVVPPADKWVNASGHEAGASPAFESARGLGTTYDHANNPATPAVKLRGGYEVNGYEGNAPNHTLTISVVMPKTIDPEGVASLTFWAAARPGKGADGTGGTAVRIRDVTRKIDLVPPSAPRFALDATQWRYNRFTFAQQADYAGDTIEVIFSGGGMDGGSGLELADITFQSDAPIESRGCIPQEKDAQRHEQFLQEKQEALKNGPIEMVFVGDSITDFWRGQPQYKIYSNRWSKYNAYNIGLSGDETQHVLWRIQHGELDGIQPRLVVLMIGTNNIGNQNHMSVGETVKGIRCVVAAIRKKLPETKILLLGVFPRGTSPNDPFRPMITSINKAISKLDDGKSVKYLNINDKFLDKNGRLPLDLFPDALHPNAKGYEIWADAIGPTVEQMMQGPEPTTTTEP
jgi:beta-glucosidase